MALPAVGSALDPHLGFLAQRRGWTLAGGDLPLHIQEEFRAFVLARRGAERILLCEAAVGRSFPDYFDRRCWREPLAAGARAVIFTDGARVEYVWTCRDEGPAPAGRYLEYLLPDQAEALAAHVKAWRGAPERRPRSASTPPVAPPELTALLSRRMGAPDQGEGPSIPRLQEWIEELAELEPLRRAWRALRELAVLDPECGAGDWLLAAGCGVEATHLALLDRARSWLIDGRRDRAAHRPEHLKDLRGLVASADDRRTHTSDRIYVRRAIVQRQLFGMDRSLRAVRACRQRLLRWAGLSDLRLAQLDANIRLFTEGPKGRSRRESAGAVAPAATFGNASPAGPAELVDEIALLQAAWRQIRHARLEGQASRSELLEAVRALEARRRVLASRIREATGLAFDYRVEFAGAESGEGFGLVRRPP